MTASIADLARLYDTEPKEFLTYSRAMVEVGGESSNRNPPVGLPGGDRQTKMVGGERVELPTSSV
jgi:hypothetical protein